MITREDLNRRLCEYNAALPSGTSITWSGADEKGVVEIAVWTPNGYTFVGLDTVALVAHPGLLEEKVGRALERLASQ